MDNLTDIVMNKQSLHFTSLHVRKMPGLPDGLKPVKDLSGHVNIIAGPNASGKTSTATAIHQLLWPPKSGRMTVDGTLELGNGRWDVRLDYGIFRAQLNGVDGELSGIPATDESLRYNFALQELVHINDKELAGKIYQEAMGGYNLGAAAAALKYSPDIKKKNTPAYAAVTNADSHLAEISSKHQELKEQENTLSLWIASRQKAADAGKLADFYKAVMSCMEARQLKESAEFKLSGFPKPLAGMFGNEYREITKLEERIEELAAEKESHQRLIQQHKDTITELGLPERGISAQLLKELDDRVEQLTGEERKIAESATLIASLSEQMEALKLQIYQGYQPGDEIKVDLAKITKLDEFIADAHGLLSQAAFIQTQIDFLSKKSAPKNQDAGQIRDGIKALTRWFDEAGGTGGISSFWLWILVVCAGAVAIAVGLWGWWGIAGVILLIILALTAQSRKADMKADVRREDFIKTGLTGPTDWQPENVRILFEDLNVQLQEAEFYGIEKREADRLSNELQLLQPRLQQIETQRDEWINLLGHAPALPAGDLKNYSSFFWYISLLSDYARQSAALSGQKGMHREALNQHQAALKKINDLLTEFGAAAADGATAKAVVRLLAEKENRRSTIAVEIQGLVELVNEKERQLKDGDLKLDEIFQRTGVETKDKHSVYLLTEQLDEYKKAVSLCQEKTTLYGETERLQLAHDSYATQKNEISGFDIAAVRRLCDEVSAEAAGFEALNNRIISTKALVQERKAGHDLEDALAGKEAALDNLQQTFEDNLSAMTGSLLIGHLEKEGGERNSSKVLRRGNQLFNKITNGRYELRINDIAQLDFLAYDHRLHEGQSLDQLSSGTRIQLLLCIRLAYIESQEKEFQIPIIADELLANSDDERAYQIIEALAEIAVEGRQVFYFTAQNEEIAKWKSYAAKHEGFEVNIYRLESDASEHSDYSKIDDRPFSIDLFDKVPAAEGQTHESYKKLMAIPAFQLMGHVPSQIHLWYLIDDLRVLVTCLEHRISTYGQLNSYLNNGGTLEGIGAEALERMEKLVSLLAAYQELYEKGRPKVIDLNVLKSSGAVSATHINSVYQVLEEVSFNPEELIDRLNNKAVSGFRSNNKDRLEAYLVEEGYISQEHILPEDEIKQLIQIKVKKLGMDPSVAKHFLERVNNA